MTVFCVVTDLERDIAPMVRLAGELARRCDDDLALVDVLWPMTPAVAPAAAPGVVPTVIELEPRAPEPPARAGRLDELRRATMRRESSVRSTTTDRRRT